MFVENFIKLSAVVHKLSRLQASLPHLAMVKNSIFWSSHLDRSPTTLKINVWCGCQNSIVEKISSS